MRALLAGLDLTHKQRGLEVAVREAIRGGRLRPGDALPSSRALAADLEMARATVVAAYDQLIGEGYLVSRPGALTRVAPGQWSQERPAPDRTQPPYRLDLIPGEPDARGFPRAAWLRCTREVLTTAPDRLFGYGDPAGLGELRSALAGYLNRSRATAATPEAITVVPGASNGLAVVAKLLGRLGATAVGVEEPGFPFHQVILRREGLRLAPVPVDAEGIDVDTLAASGVKVVVVTPAHQYPIGTVMSPQRRASLVSWARQHRAWIIEDDYDGEFRYDRQPIGALQGIAADRVIYLGTTSKTIGAGLRVGWVILPPELRSPMAELRGRDNDVSQLTQAILARFISQGDLDRHVRRGRLLYQKRRDHLLETLHAVFEEPDVRGISAGLHLTLGLPGGKEATVVAHALHEHRIALWGLRQHYLTGDARDGLVLGFGRTPTDFHDSTTVLAQTLRLLI